jgi:amidase
MHFILASVGPLSYDINALEIFMRSVVNARPSLSDSSVIDLPWRSLTDESVVRLRIGLLAEDPQFPLHPPVKRTMAEAVRKLQAQGHAIIPLDAAKCHVANATEIAWKIFMIDETAYRHVHAGEEPLIPSVVYTHAMARSLGSKFIPDLSGYDRLSQLAVLRKLRAVVIDDWRQIWVDNELDIVLSPSAQTTAVEHDRFGLPAYTTLTNIFDVSLIFQLLALSVVDTLNR